MPGWVTAAQAKPVERATPAPQRVPRPRRAADVTRVVTRTGAHGSSCSVILRAELQQSRRQQGGSGESGILLIRRCLAVVEEQRPALEARMRWHRQADRGVPVADPSAIENVLHVLTYSGDGDEQDPGDIRVAIALRRQPKDLPLPRADMDAATAPAVGVEVHRMQVRPQQLKGQPVPPVEITVRAPERYPTASARPRR